MSRLSDPVVAYVDTQVGSAACAAFKDTGEGGISQQILIKVPLSLCFSLCSAPHVSRSPTGWVWGFDSL